MRWTGKSFMHRILVFALLLGSLGGAARSQIKPAVNAKLGEIFEEAKTAFFDTTGKILQNHPMKSLLGEADLAKVLNARKDIPYLYERLMIYAYQKDELLYAQWTRQGSAASLEKFRKAFVALAEDYAARFVGSLFRKARLYDFAMSLPHNRGKSRLELVLQSMGFGARNDLPDFPKDRRYANTIEPEYRSQWAIDALDVRPCWPETKGSGVVTAVIDSGLDPYNSLFKQNTVAGFNFLVRTSPPWTDESPSMIDWGMHGTGCSSALLAIAPESLIMPVRVHDGDTMNDPAYDYWIYEFVAAGIYYAVHHGAQVISLSAPLPATELVLREAVRYAYQSNVPVCTSAGNTSRVQFGIRLEDQLFKGIKKDAILVGGVARENGIVRAWPFTIPHDEMTVAAPSADVFVLVPVYMPDMKDMAVAGTSLSAPLVAGVVTLLRAGASPSLELIKKPGEYSRLVSLCLVKTARLDVLGLSEPDDVVGYGLVDAYKAFKMMKNLILGRR